MKSVSILQLSTSNCQSVQSSLSISNIPSVLVRASDLELVKNDSVLILPGVGHMSSLAREIEGSIGTPMLTSLIREKNLAVIGICLGFQYMCQYSEESPDSSCLGLFEAPISPLSTPLSPSVGWKSLIQRQRSTSATLDKALTQGYFYFTHSYGLLDKDMPSSYVSYSCGYGPLHCAAAFVQNSRFFGIQFHPEKSSNVGRKVLEAVLEIC